MTQFNTPTYDLQRVTGKCAMTGRPLEPGEKYFTTLVEVGGEDASGRTMLLIRAIELALGGNICAIVMIPAAKSERPHGSLVASLHHV